MTKEVRLLFITSLTLLIYALSIFFDKDAFLFPFPLNQFIVLIVSAQFTFWNFKKYKLASILMLIIGLLSTLGNEFYWSIFLNYESMTVFSNTIITDVFQLLSGIITIVLGILFVSKQNRALNYLLSSFFCFTFIAGLIISTPLFSSLLLSISYFILTISVRIKPVFKPIHIFWILLLTLEASKFISILFNK